MMSNTNRPKRKETDAQRFDNLAATFERTVEAMRHVIKKLPSEQQLLLAGKVEVIDLTHSAMIEEFAYKPQN